jgi:hypothetical protein
MWMTQTHRTQALHILFSQQMLTLVINERKHAEDVVSIIRVACTDGLALMT